VNTYVALLWTIMVNMKEMRENKTKIYEPKRKDKENYIIRSFIHI
jgi:hypothetical protein